MIESLGGAFIGDGLSSLAVGGTLITIGYTAGRKAGIDVTDLIWKRARMAGFALVSADARREAESLGPGYGAHHPRRGRARRRADLSA